MKEKKFNAELIISITAMVTAIVAVVVGMVQTQVMQDESLAEREHQKLSVTPSLWLSRNIWDDGEKEYLSFTIKNQGLGPAVIEDFSVSYRGEKVSDWFELLSKISLDVHGSDLLNGRAFPANSQRVNDGHIIPAEEMLKPVQINGDKDVLSLLVRGNEHITMSLCYCSFYEDCWQTQLHKRPEPVESCPESDVYFNSSLFREPKLRNLDKQ
ncbi:hypothetical protein EYS14_06510 [Alteromonadaceae bacterium M269]|nr:hypothetical protein EYS14_06510 [Alteromonadaceae bacterium M269]